MIRFRHPYRRYQDWFTRPRRLRLAMRFMPSLLRHHVFRPVRRGVGVLADDERGRRMSDSLYDAMHGLVLDGYREMIGHRLHPDSGRMLFLVSRWMRAMDDVFESQIAGGENPTVESLYADPNVQFNRERTLRFSSDRRCDASVAKTVDDFVASNLTRYVEAIRQTIDHRSIEHADEVIHIDSGVFLQSVMRCVGHLNNLPIDPVIDASLLHLGIAGSIADDLLDVGYDHMLGDSNYVMAVAGRYDDEREVIVSSPPNVGSFGAKWWRRHAPQTYRDTFAKIQWHHVQIQPSAMRRLDDLYLTSITYGYDFKHAKRPRPTVNAAAAG